MLFHVAMSIRTNTCVIGSSSSCMYTLSAAIFPPDAFEKASLLSAALRSRMKQGVLKSGDLTQVEIGEQRYAYGGILLGLLS